VLFENAITPETYTLPAHVSMLTGLYPKKHGCTPNSTLAEETITLSEALNEAGYLSAGFTGFNGWLALGEEWNKALISIIRLKGKFLFVMPRQLSTKPRPGLKATPRTIFLCFCTISMRMANNISIPIHFLMDR